MQWYRSIGLALRTLSRHRLRSLLMMAGITIGIASLTAMAAIGETTKRETIKQFEAMVGTFDVINVQPGGGRTRGMPSLTTVEPSLRFADAPAIAELEGVAAVAEVQNAFDIDVKYRDRATASAIYGIAANWLQMHRYFVDVGNLIDQDDVISVARVAVIGPDVAAELFPDEDPIGKQLRIGNVPFQIKGILESRGAGPGGGSLDNIVFIPVTTASKRLFNRDYLTTITVQSRDPERPEKLIDDITLLLRERHGIVPPGEDDFTVSNPRAAMDRVTEVRSAFATVLAGIAVIATIIGGTVIMSLMLIAVSERQREIGVRRAVGASRFDVMLQFLIEAATVSLIGGMLGIAIGIAAAAIATAQRDALPALTWDVIGLTVAVSVGTGLIFGLQPAWKAANVDPIEALRA